MSAEDSGHPAEQPRVGAVRGGGGSRVPAPGQDQARLRRPRPRHGPHPGRAGRQELRHRHGHPHPGHRWRKLAGLEYNYRLQSFALVSEALKIVAEQRRMLDQTRADAERLSGRDSHKDDYFLQVADQSGKSLDLPQEEKTSLIIAMSLHEKGRTAMKK